MGPGRRALVLVLAAPALFLGACGDGGDPDVARIERIVKEIAVDNAALCEHATASLLSMLGPGREACEEAARGYQASAESGVDGDIEIHVAGDTATAAFSTLDGSDRRVTFVRVGDDWQIDTVSG
jgi:hypothetical protein